MQTNIYTICIIMSLFLATLQADPLPKRNAKDQRV